MALRLPSRYKDLDAAYHGRLVPDQKLLALVNGAKKSIDMSGGVRFLRFGDKAEQEKVVQRLKLVRICRPYIHLFYHVKKLNLKNYY